MKKTATWVAAMAIAATACAQQKPDQTAIKYSKLITPEFAKMQLSIIAADDMEGRETGKPGAEKAANYLAGEYKKLGLLPANKGSYFLDIPLVMPSFKVNSFSVNGTALTIGKDFTATGASPAKTVNVKDVVFVGYGSTDELTADITGKIVMYIAADKPAKAGDPAPAAPAAGGRRRGFGLSPARMAIMQALNAKKPALLLAINPMMTGAGGRGGFGGGGRLAIKKDGPAVETQVSYTIGAEVADQVLKSSGKTFADLKTAIDGGTPQSQIVKADIATSFASDDKDVHSVDIVAMIPGSDPKLKDEVLVFSAHYDHIGLVADPNAKDKVNNGADDDGSGTTGILSIARAFMAAKKDGHGPRRTILFLGNVGEEKGLLGSEYYVEHPVFPLANTITDLNIDMIGRIGDVYKNDPDSANYVFPIGSAMLSSTLHQITEDANNTYTKLKLDYRYDDLNDKNNFYGRSDHYNFAKHGIPIVFWFNGTHPDYHQPGDEVSKINFPLLAKRAQHAYFVGWELANRDNRPVVDAKDAPKN
ncbi:MAG: M28 family peptidase [Bacteroidota bacterium]